jgi:hypothetical protein
MKSVPLYQVLTRISQFHTVMQDCRCFKFSIKLWGEKNRKIMKVLRQENNLYKVYGSHSSEITDKSTQHYFWQVEFAV